jgi:hypothetical protein
MCRYTFINQKDDQKILAIKPSSNDNNEDAGEKPRTFFFNYEKVRKSQLFVFVHDLLF